MTDETTDDGSRTNGGSGSSSRRRRALAAMGAAGAAVGFLASPASAQTGGQHRLEATSPGGTTLWQAAVSSDSNFRQVQSDDANDTISLTIHETGEQLTTLTAYTRDGTDAFAFDGEPSDLRYLAVSYSTGGEPTITLDGQEIQPFGEWETASPEGIGPAPL